MPPMARNLIAQLDVRTATGHVGRDGDLSLFPCECDDLRLTFDFVGVEDLNFHALLAQHACKDIRFVDRSGADEHRASNRMHFEDFLNDAFEFFHHVFADDVWKFFALGGAIRRDLEHRRAIDLAKLPGAGRGRTGHARKVFVAKKQVLDGDAGRLARRD